ncbi:MAG: hypothetical protein AB8B55_19660 [Mariniblastus sp.]
MPTLKQTQFKLQNSPRVFRDGIRVVVFVCLLSTMLTSVGCRTFYINNPAPNLSGAAPVSNPMIVPLIDRWLLMDQVSDEMDDYFKIYREERIRVMDGVMSEGWIETHPEIGSTLLEPWKKDSTSGFEKLHATLQTVRRFAKVRVIPTGNGFQIDVKVFKELEDLKRPKDASISGRPFRNDSSLDVDQVEPWLKDLNEGWIPMGRDFSLEQKILRNIQQRLNRVMETGGPQSGY